MHCSWGYLGALVASSAFAAAEGPGGSQFIQAARADSPVTIDGKLDEAAWQRAPVFDAFVQRFPVEGPPSERTELRVLFDDSFVYVAIACHDSGQVIRSLGRRDGDIVGDTVHLHIDPTHEHRTAYSFVVNAGGVQTDGVLFDDRNYTKDWDAVWASAVGDLEGGGWLVEYAIPLHLLRYPQADVQTWGFAVKREIFRKQEEVLSVQNPRDSGAYVSRFGHLTGLAGLQQRRTLELLPYASGRTLLSSLGAPRRALLPSADVGLDFKVGLTSDLNLTGAFNPDFGQVEADQIILNLSTFEAFFPEKRPFFNQGLELFAPVGSEFGGTPFQLFYSRRIGLETPILAAAKLTGTVAKGVEVSILDSVVAGPYNDAPEGEVDRSPHYSFSRPFHVGTRAELPSTERIPYNYFASVVRSSLGANSRVGASFTAATPLTGECTQSSNPQSMACRANGGNSAGLDWNLRTGNGEWGTMGQLVASMPVGGPPSRQLRDGIVLERGELGYGGYMRTGRFGGTHRFDLNYDFTSPTLELNALGFQRTNNDQMLFGGYHFVKPSGLGPLKSFEFHVAGGTKHTTGALAPDRADTPNYREDKLFSRVGWVNVRSEIVLPSFDEIGFESGADIAGYNVRDIPGRGIPLEYGTRGYFGLFAGTNPSRVWRFGGFAAFGARLADAVTEETRYGWIVDASVRLRPTDALETTLQVVQDRTEHGPRYISTLAEDPANDGGTFLFGDLQSNFLSVTLRQQWIVTPRLALQAYAQLFTSYGLFQGDLYEESSHRGRPIHYKDLTPSANPNTGEFDFYETALNVNVLLRWEYRLGSNLFVVYTRSQQGQVRGGAPRTLLPQGLFSAPANDAVLVKWTYYWSA